MASSSTLADRRAMIPRAKRGEIFTAEEVEMMKNDPLNLLANRRGGAAAVAAPAAGAAAADPATPPGAPPAPAPH